MTLRIASAPNNVILRCYNSDICFQRELYKWLPCLTFFNDHWYVQNKVLTPWSKIYILSGLPTLPPSSRVTCPWHIILLVGTDCSLTFHVPLCLCTLAYSHPETSSSIVSIWRVPTHLSWLTSSIFSLGICPWGPASRQNGHSHFCFPRPPLPTSSTAMKVSY